eukprot:Rhum_TRINITY_DN18640_c0_g1::Rhum_TRINITY_DN18640_c0_g1_i1::g.167841::m.167841
MGGVFFSSRCCFFSSFNFFFCCCWCFCVPLRLGGGGSGGGGGVGGGGGGGRNLRGHLCPAFAADELRDVFGRVECLGRLEEVRVEGVVEVQETLLDLVVGDLVEDGKVKTDVLEERVPGEHGDFLAVFEWRVAEQGVDDHGVVVLDVGVESFVERYEVSHVDRVEPLHDRALFAVRGHEVVETLVGGAFVHPQDGVADDARLGDHEHPLLHHPHVDRHQPHHYVQVALFDTEERAPVRVVHVVQHRDGHAIPVLPVREAFPPVLKRDHLLGNPLSDVLRVLQGCVVEVLRLVLLEPLPLFLRQSCNQLLTVHHIHPHLAEVHTVQVRHRPLRGHETFGVCSGAVAVASAADAPARNGPPHCGGLRLSSHVLGRNEVQIL